VPWKILPRARAAILRIPAEERGENGDHFLATPAREWFLSAGELHITKHGSAGAWWDEPRHQDGAGSILHLSLTLAGRRDVRCEQPHTNEVIVPCRPGTVWLGQLTGCWHQVHHRLAEQAEYLQTEHGPLSITIQMRTSLFPRNRARQRNTTPSPAAVFFTVARIVREGFAAHTWRLPSLEGCRAAGRLPAPAAAEAAGQEEET